MKLYCILVLLICGHAFGNLVRHVRTIDHVDYIISVVSKTVQEIEARQWSNLKVPNPDPIKIDETVLGWHAKGSVSYTNAFVVSIQGVDLIRQSVGQQVNLNGNRVARAVLRGTLRLHDVAMGYDVKADLEDGTSFYTVKYIYPLINMDFNITKVINGDHIEVTVTGNLLNRRTEPIFMPSDRLSDTLSSLFNPAMFTPGIIAWGADVFQPIAKRIVTTEIDFPEICYNCA
ncbi:unnamed protein product [Arctia plantaginis]|uniref:Uncharacterized protein n=1 Tax=Arctia plantaginis TaxID=874455 RepID=A0A8S1AQN7_ARCPL|nr:unnamed protein product [Arctia plantaginis]